MGSAYADHTIRGKPWQSGLDGYTEHHMDETTPAPVRRRGKPMRSHPGRGGWKPTAHQRKQVEILVGARMPEVDIARLFNVSHNTLRKHCGEELRTGFSKRHAQMILAQFQSGIDGKVAAQNAYLRRGEFAPIQSATDRREKAPTKLGKKEQALHDALNPDTSTPMGERMARRVAEAALH